MKKSLVMLMSVSIVFYCSAKKKENAVVFNKNIIQLTKDGTNFREVLATGKHSQVVIMSVLPGQDIGLETHTVDQVLVFIEGTGKAIVGGKESTVTSGDLFLVPAGTSHNFINTGKADLKLFTVYAPAEFEHAVIEKVKK